MTTRIARAALLALSLTAPLSAQEPPAQPTEVQQLERALTVAPDNAGLWVELAAANARAGNKAEALRWIEKAVVRGLDFDLAENPAFGPFQETPEFKNLLARAALNRRVVNRSKTAFRLAEKDLIPEGIAHDPKTGDFFVGSILKRKIVRIDKTGKVSDFKTSGQDGLWEVIGMEVDPATRTLWACSAAGSAAAATESASALFRFNVDTGKLLGKFLLPGQETPHLCNDIALGQAGEVFLTDSKPGLVHRLRPGKGQIEVLVGPGILYYPNGIAVSPDFKKLYVADFGNGLSIVDVATGELRPLPYSKTVIVAGIDGLYFHNGSLLAVQNGASTRIVRYRLNAALDAIESEEILESRNPLFQIPTTGVPVGDSFFYIANSQLLALDEFGKLRPDAKLEESVILEVPLGR